MKDEKCHEKSSRPFTPAELDELLRAIDPETAEVTWCYADVLDPYAMTGAEPTCVGREYFASAPHSDAWVSFRDLPEPVRAALWKKHRRDLAFPAGLEPRTG